MKKNIKHLSLLAITLSAILSACGASYTSSSTTSSNTSISSSESSSNTSSSIINNKEVKGHTYKYHSAYIKVERGTIDKETEERLIKDVEASIQGGTAVFNNDGTMAIGSSTNYLAGTYEQNDTRVNLLITKMTVNGELHEYEDQPIQLHMDFEDNYLVMLYGGSGGSDYSAYFYVRFVLDR